MAKAYDVTEPDAQLQKAMCELTGTVTGVAALDHLNLRVRPDPNSDVMNMLENGAALRIRGEEIAGDDKWLLVSVGDQTGWVNARYVKL